MHICMCPLRKFGFMYHLDRDAVAGGRRGRRARGRRRRRRRCKRQPTRGGAHLALQLDSLVFFLPRSTGHVIYNCFMVCFFHFTITTSETSVSPVIAITWSRLDRLSEPSIRRLKKHIPSRLTMSPICKPRWKFSIEPHRPIASVSVIPKFMLLSNRAEDVATVDWKTPSNLGICFLNSSCDPNTQSSRTPKK